MKITNLFLPFLLLLCINQSYQLDFIPPHLKEEYGDALEAIFGIGVRLQVLLEDPLINKNENFIVSPVSAALVLGQLMIGAEGEFREHLYDLLSLPKYEMNAISTHSKDGQNVSMPLAHAKLHIQLGMLSRNLKKSSSLQNSFTLENANALFSNKDIVLNREFKHNLNLLYETQIYELNYKDSKECLNFINKWGSDHTKGLINSVLQMPPPPNTAGIFANAIYFLGEWEQPFSSELNTIGAFKITSKKSIDVTYMTGFLEQIPYAESTELNCKLLNLPYINRELGMYIILPNEGHMYEFDIRRFAGTINTTRILKLMNDLKNRDVVVKIPKLSLTNSMSILKPLQKYAAYKKIVKNVKNIQSNVLDDLEQKIAAFQRFKSSFEQDIVLSGAAEDNIFTVNDIVQQMTFAINEKGTEAAAITASIMDYNGGSKSFLATKPFVFFIRHEATAATLFWGTIANPEA